MENQNPQNQAAEQEVPKVTLLSAISYTSREDYEAFLNNMSTEHAVVTLIAAANHAQAQGAYNLDEAELVAKSIRKLTVRQAAPAEAPQAQEQPAPTQEPAAPKARKPKAIKAEKPIAKEAPKKVTRARKK